MSTGFDLDSLEFLNKIGIRLAKIPSGEITNFPYLKKVEQLFSEVILSTGMCTLDEVRNSVNAILDSGNDQLSLLHCVSDYPTKPEETNLNAIVTLKNEFNLGKD